MGKYKTRASTDASSHYYSNTDEIGLEEVEDIRKGKKNKKTKGFRVERM